MRLRQQFIAILCAVAVAFPVVAAEVSVNDGERAVLRAMGERADQRRDDYEARIKALEAKVELMKACMALGKFYAPGTAGADAKGCVDIDI